MKKQSLINCIIFITFGSFCIGQQDMFSSGSNRPRANAGPDIQIIKDQKINLDASRSFIRDGSKLKFEWILSPGVALKSDNMLNNAISVDLYRDKYLKTIQTNEKILEIIPAKNKIGTKLEIILNVKDRIGFQDSDTLYVEYIKEPVKENLPKEMPDSLAINSSNIKDNSLVAIDTLEQIDSSLIKSGVLIQGLEDKSIDIINFKIINTIIADQIQKIGFQDEILFNSKTKDLIDNGFECKTDSCVIEKASKLKMEYVLIWNISDSRESLFLKLYKLNQIDGFLDSYSILKPLVYISESGIYGLDFEIRKAIDAIFYKKNLYRDLSRSGKINRRKKQIVKMGKYPAIIGATYLLIDKLFFANKDKQPSELPPGFPHDS